VSARVRVLVMALASAALAGGSACRGTGNGVAPAPLAAGDTVRGIVNLVGSEPLAVLVVAPRRGDVVVPSGDDVKQLRTLTGIEVTLAGAMTDDCVPDGGPRGARVFAVTQFAVRAMNGVAAVDGTLQQEGELWVLATSDGRHVPIIGLPQALESQAGARVYFVGPLDRPPQAYGIIKPASR
jgi:hypothetical protein